MTAAILEGRPATEETSGVIERVTFHNDDSGFYNPAAITGAKVKSLKLLFDQFG